MVMKIEIMEAFGDYSGITSGGCAFSQNWVSVTDNGLVNGIITSPSEGGKSLRIGGGAGFFPCAPLHMFAVPVQKVTISFGFTMLDVVGTSSQPRALFALTDDGGVPADQLQVYFTPGGKLQITGEGQAVLATSETNLLEDTVYRICMEVDYTTGANQVDTRCSINGFPDPGLNKTNLDFQDQGLQGAGGFRLFTAAGAPWGTGGDWEVHHVIVGTGECEDWGPLEVLEGPPNEDIAVAWTRSAGAVNYGNVDEAPADADGTYNFTETLNAKDVFGFTDPEIPERVIAVGVVSWHKKEDSATRKFRHLLRITAVDYAGPDVFCAETYGRRVDAWVTDPSTLAEWDPSDLAALNFGYEYMGS